MSFLLEINKLLERKDVEFSTQLNSINKKITNFLNKYKKFLINNKEKLLNKENGGYYITYNSIDPKTKYNDLWIAFLPKGNSISISDKINIKNIAGLRTRLLINGEEISVVEFYIIEPENEDSFKNIFNFIKTHRWRSSLNHELTHYLDNKKINKKIDNTNIRRNIDLNSNDINDVLNSLKTYYNLNDEINAHFHQSASEFLKTAIKNKNIDFLNMSFKNFKDAFIYFYGEKAFESLKDKNKILKRIYLFYKDLQEFIQKKKEKKKK